MPFVVMGACGHLDSSDLSVWPSCVVESAAIAEALATRFEHEVQALLAEWQEWDIAAEPIFREKLQLLLALIPDPSIRARHAREPSGVEYELYNVRYGQWRYSYVEVSGLPRLGSSTADATLALNIENSR
ncbi:MAG: hypothetical protein JWO56_2648 [Acidobacteria bacterium]|nr:hypothetical protein [Acidobacteriota bacterium]